VREVKKAKDERPIEIEMLVSSKHYPALIGERSRIEEACGVKLVNFPCLNLCDQKKKKGRSIEVKEILSQLLI